MVGILPGWYGYAVGGLMLVSWWEAGNVRPLSKAPLEKARRMRNLP